LNEIVSDGNYLKLYVCLEEGTGPEEDLAMQIKIKYHLALN
jgi:hypothetical protein